MSDANLQNYRISLNILRLQALIAKAYLDLLQILSVTPKDLAENSRYFLYEVQGFLSGKKGCINLNKMVEFADILGYDVEFKLVKRDNQ